MRKPPAEEAVELFRFNRLIRELITGSCKRSRFDPWEIELLMDIADCKLSPARLPKVLGSYQRWIQRNMQNGMEHPVGLSQYLARARARRNRKNWAA
jgi:hypothetical protein